VEIDLRSGGAQAVTLARLPRRPAPAAPVRVRRKGEPVDPFETSGAR